MGFLGGCFVLYGGMAQWQGRLIQREPLGEPSDPMKRNEMINCGARVSN